MVNNALALDVGSNYASNTDLGSADPRDMIVDILAIVFTFFGIIAVIIIMYAGWLWMTSNGNSDQVDKAKKAIIGAVIGIIIMLASYGIVTFIINSMAGVAGGATCGGVPLVAGNICCPDGVTQVANIAFCPALPVIPPVGVIYCDSDGDPFNASCSADSTMCPNPSTYCDVITCICSPKADVGDPCHDLVFPATCYASTTPPCLPDLNCNHNINPLPDCRCTGAPVIDWVTPMGGFCHGNINVPCNDDISCAAFAPNTCATSTPNGAIGNLVTIGGRYFGTATGTIFFYNGVNNSTVSGIFVTIPGCTDLWTHNQVIVEVPAGTVTDGQIRIVRAVDAEEDWTGDLVRGPIIPNFVVNTIVRPGICGLSTTTGQMEDVIEYYGLNFEVVDTVSYGEYSSPVPALNPSFPWTLIPRTAQVPNITAGNTTTFVADSIIYSNYYRFTKLEEPYSGPYITRFEPTRGAPGQYVTIHGSGFGRHKGVSAVDFGGHSVDYDFPDVCADSVWSNTQVIVKVGTSTPNGIFLINMQIGSWPLITSTNTIPSHFTVNAADPLLPGVCKINPKIGPQNSEVSLWGEYFNAFNNPNSIVKFHLNQDQIGGNIGFWDLDPYTTSGIVPYLATTTVSQLAASGPVKIAKDFPSLVGNGVNFTVGICTDAGDTQDKKNEACGPGNYCCGVGSVQEGRCVADASDCFSMFNKSEYVWSFSTILSTSTLMNDSCDGISNDTCFNVYCPNSPGICSVYPATTTALTTQCSDANCNTDFIECINSGSDCVLDATLNSCINRELGVIEVCDLASTTLVTDIFGGQLTTYCDDYGGNDLWHINTPMSCPTNWVSLFGGKCVLPLAAGGTCVMCETGFSCLNDNDGDFEGVCAVDRKVCSNGAFCDLGVCKISNDEGCECCCGIGNSAIDCCSFYDPVSMTTVQLTCEDECGTDLNVDTDTFGNCTGCRIDTNSDGSINAVEQVLSDEACNCSHTMAKYCDVDAGIDASGLPQGVCHDCAGLSSNPNGCSIHHATCCVDAVGGDICKGGYGTVNAGLNEFGYAMNASGPYAYCSYYECNNALTDWSGDAVASSTIASSSLYIASSTAESECRSSGNFGAHCAVDIATCDMNYCSSAYECLENGMFNFPFPPVNPTSGCGNCCCDLNKSGLPTDTCKNLKSYMYCDEDSDLLSICHDVSPAGPAPDFGTCCGCSEDADCGNLNFMGCGVDTCCHSRPQIATTTPLDGATSICRNAKIRVEFNIAMDVTSFHGNVIVVGDYGSLPCPAGTTYLVKQEDKKRNIFVKVFYTVKDVVAKGLNKILPQKYAIAYTIPTATNNYCAVLGGVDGFHYANGHGILDFSPQEVFGADIMHYVIIKGDELPLDSAQGILSNLGVGMNSDNFPDYSNSPAVGNIQRTFNGRVFDNAYVFSFKTLDDQGPNNGICILEEVDLIPDSYLFQTITGDPNEPDDEDYAKDNDKIFVADTKTLDGQLIVPLVGIYSWYWNWQTSNYNVANFVNVASFSDDKELVRATSTTDGRTDINVKALATAGNVFGPPANETMAEDTSPVYVFVCENPWPPINHSTGYWEPWIDNSTNCTAGAGDCFDMSYELYYCRDTASAGSYDDLPAVMNDAVIRRGTTTAGVSAKEVYYFRGQAPIITVADSATFLVVASTTAVTGGAIVASWDIPSNASGTTIYWGVSSDNYPNSVVMDEVGYETNDNVSCSVALPTYTCNISNLSNNIVYYFNVTTYEGISGTESEYYGEIMSTANDIVIPDAVTWLIARSADGAVDLTWNPILSEAVSYNLYYSAILANANIGNYAYIENLGDNTSIEVGGLQNGSHYYFAIGAIDASGNEATTSPKDLMPVAARKFLYAYASSTDPLAVNLSWDLSNVGPGNAGVADVIIEQTGFANNIYNLGAHGISYSIGGLTSGSTYYFVVRSENSVGDQSIDSDEVSFTIP